MSNILFCLPLLWPLSLELMSSLPAVIPRPPSGARTAHFAAQYWLCITGVGCLLALKLLLHCLVICSHCSFSRVVSRDEAVLLVGKTNGKDRSV